MTDDFEERIRDIRGRIAELRDALHSSRPESSINHVEVPQTTRVVERTTEAEKEKRNAEMNDLKAKLLGRMKK